MFGSHLKGETTSKQNRLSMSSKGLTEHSRRSSTTTVGESCRGTNTCSFPREQEAGGRTVRGTCLEPLLVDQLAVLDGEPASGGMNADRKSSTDAPSRWRRLFEASRSHLFHVLKALLALLNR